MLRLFIDTALKYSYIALEKDGVILKEDYNEGSNNHSETLFPVLKGMLDELNISLRDVNEVYVGIGPGSYTGVRIGVVIAKMIGAMNNIPVYSVSSLAFLASSTKGEAISFVDCRRGNAFVARFNVGETIERLEDDSVVVISDYFNSSKEELKVIEGKPNPLILIGSKEAKKVEDINALSPNYLQLVEAERIKKGLK